MAIDLLPWADADLESARTLLRHPSLAGQFDMLTGPGELERMLADPFYHPGMRWLARGEGGHAGIAFAYLMADGGAPWAMLRVAVTGSHRRRGLGSRLLEKQLECLRRLMPTCREVCMSSWEPCEAGWAFASAKGFTTVRRFWLMERPADHLMALEWPEGIRVEVFDGGEAAMEDWNAVYNASFAEHYHYVPSTTDTCRRLVASPGFDPSGVLLAYDGDRCVGFCRDERHAERGEVGVLGVAPEARGRGLGRALLRWGVAWLAERDYLPITLFVDGENERALALYRSEGFRVVRTRQLWAKGFSAA